MDPPPTTSDDESGLPPPLAAIAANYVMTPRQRELVDIYIGNNALIRQYQERKAEEESRDSKSSAREAKQAERKAAEEKRIAEQEREERLRRALLDIVDEGRRRQVETLKSMKKDWNTDVFDDEIKAYYTEQVEKAREQRGEDERTKVVDGSKDRTKEVEKEMQECRAMIDRGNITPDMAKELEQHVKDLRQELLGISQLC